MLFFSWKPRLPTRFEHTYLLFSHQNATYYSESSIAKVAPQRMRRRVPGGCTMLVRLAPLTRRSASKRPFATGILNDFHWVGSGHSLSSLPIRYPGQPNDDLGPRWSAQPVSFRHRFYSLNRVASASVSSGGGASRGIGFAAGAAQADVAPTGRGPQPSDM
jgi:hypothetical protein